MISVPLWLISALSIREVILNTFLRVALAALTQTEIRRLQNRTTAEAVHHTATVKVSVVASSADRRHGGNDEI